MSNPHPVLAAHKGLRGDVLHELKRAQPLTAQELATRLRVSANAVRHHLKELEATGLVTYGREQRGVGAPTYAYQLSTQGEALFPKRYEEALTGILDRLSNKQGREAAVGMLEDHFADLTRQLQQEVDGAAPERRLEVVARAMSDAGYMAEVDEQQGTFRFAEHNCAIRAVAERYPEVCAAEAKFLQAVLAATVERKAHIVEGCNACEYAITFGGSAVPPRGEPV
ncbi:MAG TPA: helix-turn-helix domain-containing protein [Gemmatimonadales bacterium]|nr:helix-turn-helix domain-containing protein [Gemmatimonadales bacterium]